MTRILEIIAQKAQDPMGLVRDKYGYGATEDVRFLFLGECHFSSAHNSFVASSLGEFVNMGFGRLVLEIDPRFQEDVNAFLSTKDREHLLEIQDFYGFFRGTTIGRLDNKYLDILEEAAENGVCIICLEPSYLEREIISGNIDPNEILLRYLGSTNDPERTLFYIGGLHTLPVEGSLADEVKKIYTEPRVQCIIQLAAEEEDEKIKPDPLQGVYELFPLFHMIRFPHIYGEEVSEDFAQKSFALDLEDPPVRKAMGLISRRGGRLPLPSLVKGIIPRVIYRDSKILILHP